MTNKSNINVDGLIKHAELKRRETIEKVDLAIRKIIASNGNINFNSVSQISGVSKSYLYKNIEIRERIEGLRKQYKNSSKPS